MRWRQRLEPSSRKTEHEPGARLADDEPGVTKKCRNADWILILQRMGVFFLSILLDLMDEFAVDTHAARYLQTPVQSRRLGVLLRTGLRIPVRHASGGSTKSFQSCHLAKSQHHFCKHFQTITRYLHDYCLYIIPSFTEAKDTGVDRTGCSSCSSTSFSQIFPNNFDPGLPAAPVIGRYGQRGLDQPG